MVTRFKKKSQIIDIGITAAGALLSVGIMLLELFGSDLAKRGLNWCLTFSTLRVL